MKQIAGFVIFGAIAACVLAASSGSAVFYASETADGSISVGLYPAPSDTGKPRAVYMFAVHDGAVWVRSQAGWSQWTGSDVYSAPSIDGDAGNPTVTRQLSSLREDFCVSCAHLFPDLQLWIGYGVDARDMLDKGNYREVLVSRVSPFAAQDTDLVEPAGLYKAPLNLLEVKLKALRGDKYTIADVNSDVDPYGVEHEINVHFEAADYPDDRTSANAKLKIRGKSTRLADLKSYSVKFNTEIPLWRNQRTLQLNKHPFDLTRVRNKLAFDLLSEIPYFNSLRTQFVHVMFDDDGNPLTNDVDYGLFTHVEKMGKEYLINRRWPGGSNIYKAEDFSFWPDSRLALKEDGSPQSKTDFERVLSIENGKDHRILVQMIDDINNEDADFNAIFAKYFNRNNYLSWLAANILLGNRDTINQNFGLVRLEGTSRFYFVPWDYDGALGFETQPDNVASTFTLYADWQLGLSNWWASPLHRRFLEQPGNLAAVEAAVEEFRVRYLTADRIKNRIDSYKPIIQGVVTTDPDLSYLQTISDNPAVKRLEWEAEYARLVSVIDDNYRGFRQRLENPMPFWQWAGLVDGRLTLCWDPSIDLQGDTVTYSLQIADRPDFNESSIRLSEDRLTNISWTTDPLPPGTYYMKVIAVDSKGNRQAGFDRVDEGGKSYLGVYKFTQ